MEGRTITDVRQMTDEEMEENGWHTGSIHANPPVFELDDGTLIYPSADPEGNGPGAIFGNQPDGTPITIIPQTDG